jgi:zinc and cadmium transporter
MSAGWPAVCLFALVAGGAGLLGVWLMYRHEPWARAHTAELITFASGLLVAGSLLYLLAEASGMVGTAAAMGWALAAFVVLYVAENHFLPHPHTRDEHPEHGGSAGIAVILGLALHSILDGVAVGAGFSADVVTGGVIVSLVVAHKLPVGIASMGALYHSGEATARAARYSVLVALLTPAAVILSYALLRGASAPVLGAVVAAAGGSFLYVGAADLLPEGQATGLRRNTLIFLLGVAVIVALLALGVEPV